MCTIRSRDTLNPVLQAVYMRLVLGPHRKWTKPRTKPKQTLPSTKVTQTDPGRTRATYISVTLELGRSASFFLQSPLPHPIPKPLRADVAFVLNCVCLQTKRSSQYDLPGLSLEHINHKPDISENLTVPDPASLWGTYGILAPCPLLHQPLHQGP